MSISTSQIYQRYRGKPVIKLGGVTVADAARVRHTLGHIDWNEQPLLVVSAPAGVTDLLYEAARKRSTKRRALLHPIRQHFAESAAQLLGAAAAARFMQSIDHWLQHHANKAGEARLVARGELWNARLIAGWLNASDQLANAIDARAFIRLDPATGRATVTPALFTALSQAGIPVITGFIACDDEQRTCNLGRDGSDLSAALIAAELGADRVDFVTSTHGIRSADPQRLGDEGLPIPAVSYRLARRITKWGGGVLHPRTIQPLRAAGIPARIFKPGQAHLATRVQASTDWPETGLGIFHVSRGTRGIEWLVPCPCPNIAARLAPALQTYLRQSGKLRKITCRHRHDRVYVRCSRRRQTRCLHTLHDGLYGTRLASDPMARSVPAIDVVVYGPGKVGSAVLRRLREQAWLCRLENGIALRLRGMVNSREGQWFAADGSTHSLPHAAFHRHLLAYGAEAPTVIIDTTSASEVAAQHLGWLQRGFGVVTANKLALSADNLHYLKLQQHPLYAASTTVGAGLPIISTLKKLNQNGQTPQSFSAVLSGSINFLLDQVNQGAEFDQALQQAIDKGLVEPDPQADLSGLDCARKGVILARLLGDSLSLADVDLEPVPDGVTLEDLRSEARQKQQLLAYRVNWHPGKLRIRLEAVRKDDGLLVPGVDNAIRIQADSRGNDIRITGPGAGIAVTADGVYRDLLKTAGRLSESLLMQLKRRAA